MASIGKEGYIFFLLLNPEGASLCLVQYFTLTLFIFLFHGSVSIHHQPRHCLHISISIAFTCFDKRLEIIARYVLIIVDVLGYVFYWYLSYFVFLMILCVGNPI